MIEARRSSLAVNVAEVLKYHELLYFLAWRDIKVRYKQAVLGAAWAVLQPLFLMLVFTVFLARIGRITSSGVPYPLFVYSGLVVWTFFSSAVTTSGNSLVGSAALITKVYFPRLLVPIAAVAASLIDFVLACVLLGGMMFYFRVTPGVQAAALPLVALLVVAFALGSGMWLAALNVRYRDVRFVLPFLMQIGLFVSSVVVPSTAVPERWRWLLLANPMSAYVEGFRAALFGRPFDGRALGIAAAITLAVLVVGAWQFGRMEREFADVI